MLSPFAYLPLAVNLLRSLHDLPSTARGGAVSIGNFDGVHRGHARLISQLCQQAARCGGPAVAFTFEPHPSALLRPDAVPPPLTWLERKVELLGELGVDWVIAYPTDRELLALEPHEFFREVVHEGLAACAMVEGPNFRFGKKRAGDIATLAQYCEQEGIELEVAVAEQSAAGDGSQPETLISSSRIRTSLMEGDVATAAGMLGRPHRIRGMVERGAERGRTIGFPTANLGSIDCLLPADGVYACGAITQGQTYAAAVNIGPNPTFAEGTRKVEAHLLQFAGDLYNQPLQLDFHQRLRGVKPFDSVDQLKTQLQQDCSATCEILALALQK